MSCVALVSGHLGGGWLVLAGAWRHTARPGLGRAGAGAGAGLGHLLVVVPPLLPDAPRAAGALAAPTLAPVTTLASAHHA